MEQWIQWKKSELINGRYEIKSLIQNKSSFSIQVIKQNENLEIIFSDGVITYRCFDESFRLHTVYQLSKNYPVIFYSQWSIFQINNSEYVKVLSLEQENNNNFMHFAIITDSTIVDIISFFEPKIIMC